MINQLFVFVVAKDLCNLGNALRYYAVVMNAAIIPAWFSAPNLEISIQAKHSLQNHKIIQGKSILFAT